MEKKLVKANFTITKTEHGWYCTYYSSSCKMFDNLITDEGLINRIENSIKAQTRDLLELRRQIKNK